MTTLSRIVRCYGAPIVVAILALALPLNVASPAWQSVLIFTGIGALVAVGLNVLTGYAGQISLGQAAFVGLGAYGAVVLGVRSGLPLPLWLLGATVTGGLLGAVVGPLALRLRGPYLIFVSLALLSLLNYVASSWTSVTGGTAGTPATMSLRLGGLDFGALSLGGMRYDLAQSMGVLIWLVLAVVMVVAGHLARGRVGRGLRAVRGNEAIAGSLGIPVARYKIVAFVFAGAVAALAGALYAAQAGYVTPENFSMDTSIEYLIMLVVGGIGTQVGPVLGAFVISAIPEILLLVSPSLPFVASPNSIGGGGISVDELSTVIYGVLLVVVLLVAPNGLATLWRSRGNGAAAALRSRHRSRGPGRRGDGTPSTTPTHPASRTTISTTPQRSTK